MRKYGLTDEDLRQFEYWFETFDLKHLEDVRRYVEMDAVSNSDDVLTVDDDLEKGYRAALQCAKSTVEMFIDQSESEGGEYFDYFNYYRK